MFVRSWPVPRSNKGTTARVWSGLMALVKKFLRVLSGLVVSSAVVSAVVSAADYRTESGVTYARVAGKDLTLNAFLPEGAGKPVPAVIEIHGGWMTPQGGHAFPGGDGFEELLRDSLRRALAE